MEKKIFKGRVVDLRIEDVHLPNGETIELEMVRHPGASAVLPVFENGDVLLIKQYRHAAGGFIFEVPAGKLDGCEDPAECALREMEEETGYKGEKLYYLTTIYTTPGFTDEKIHLYYAKGLLQTAQNLEHDELLEVIRMPLDEAVKMIYNKQIIDGKSIVTILLTKNCFVQ